MNDKIRELAEQAAQESFDDVNDLSLEVSCEDQSYQVPAAFIARLTELIVRECAKICECEWNGDADTFVASEAYNECAESIKEHFGVEE